MGEPVWVREDVVLAIHRRQLAEHGGSEGLRDPGLLDSALAWPKNLLAYSTDEPRRSRSVARGGPAPALDDKALAPTDLERIYSEYSHGYDRPHPQNATGGR